ncbi:MAG: DNA repair protein RadC [Bacteroidota bacterium]
MKRGDRSVFEPSFYHTSIKEWPEAERPREKLARSGPEFLSEAELLAILLRVGSRGVTALDLAKKLLSSCSNLRQIGRMTVSDLEAWGLGRARAATIAAVFELIRRYESASETEQPVFRSPEDVVALYGPRLRDLHHEEFWALLLSSSNQLLRDVKVSSGTLNASLVHPRECFAEAIKHRAASVLFLHNHPSGNPEPSHEDLAITRQLVEAGKILGIPVHDHVVIAGNRFASLAERGLL